MGFVKEIVFLPRLSCAPGYQHPQVLAVFVVQQLRFALIVKCQRLLAEVELLPPEAIEKGTDVFPFALGQGRSLFVPATGGVDERLNCHVMYLRNAVLGLLKCARRAHLRSTATATDSV